MHVAGRRFQALLSTGVAPVVLYLGDHDPSGLHMVQDVAARLAMFARAPVKVLPLALNKRQIKELAIPSNPTKTTDSRAKAYVEAHGNESWELDALPPQYLDDLIQTNIEKFIEPTSWAVNVAVENAQRRSLHEVADRWGAALSAVRKPPVEPKTKPKRKRGKRS